MENKIDRLEVILQSTNVPLYIDTSIFPKNIFEDISYNVDANCSDEELEDKIKILDSMDGDKYLIIRIDMTNSSKNNQKRFKSIIKDKSYKAYSIKTNSKIIVISDNINGIEEEIRSLLLVI